jgi:tetratricopeptide (TPR) repeat protein
MRQFQEIVGIANRGDTARAIAATNEFVRAHPEFAPALKLQGMLLEETGRQAEAAQSYEKGLKLAPNDADLLFKVGVYRLVGGKYDEAIALLRRSLEFEPADGDAFYYLAQAYHLAEHDDLALKAIRESIKYEPDNPSVWQKYGELLCSSGDSTTGMQWLLKAKEARPDLERIDYDLGVASLNDMDLESAAKYAATAARTLPEDANALELLASVQAKLSQWQDATATYERILAVHSDSADALLGLGHCQLQLKQYQAAVDTLNRLLAIDPTAIQAHYYLSRAYAGLGNTVEAQHHADLHQKMVEQMSFAASALGTEADRAAWPEARKLVEAHRGEEALKLFQKQEKDAANPGRPYFLVGALYLYLGQTPEGLRNLHRALEVQPRVRGAHTYLGIYALQRNRLDEAEKEFAAEIANDPNYETAVAELGLVRYRQQRWAEAADQLSRSHTRTPALLLALCDSYFRLGKTKEANLTAEIAAAYAHDDPELLDDVEELLRRNGQPGLAEKLKSRGQGL